jgi:hypothetical protein
MTTPKPSPDPEPVEGLTDSELAQRRRCVKADLEDLGGKDLSDDVELRDVLEQVQREARYLATIYRLQGLLDEGTTVVLGNVDQMQADGDEIKDLKNEIRGLYAERDELARYVDRLERQSP